MVSLRDVAESVATIETCIAAPACFAGVRHARERNPFLGWATMGIETHRYRLRDVVLDCDHMVLLKDGRIIAETNYLQSPEALSALRVRPESLVHPNVRHPVAICFDHWSSNYFHWMAHAVPTLHAVGRDYPRGDVVLLVPALTSWQSATIGLLGTPHLHRLEWAPGRQFHLAQLDYYDYVAGRADYALSPLSRAAYARMTAAAEPGPAQRRKLYIDRGDHANRRIPNEAELVGKLLERGFVAVRPETLTLPEQVALFANAAMVVAQLGAGLANIAFCRPGAIVYELLAEHHQNPCFLAMAMQGNLLYWGDVFATGVAASSHTTAWDAEIDIAWVLARVAELERLLPP